MSGIGIYTLGDEPFGDSYTYDDYRTTVLIQPQFASRLGSIFGTISEILIDLRIKAGGRFVLKYGKKRLRRHEEVVHRDQRPVFRRGDGA